MVFSPDGRSLAVGTRERGRSELHLIDVTMHTASRIGSWRGLGPDTGTWTTALAYAPDGRRLAVGLPTIASDGIGFPSAQRLLLLDARNGRPLWRRRYPFRRGQKAAYLRFLPDGALISSAQQGETLVWDAEAGRIVRRYPIGGRFGLSPDHRRLAITLNSPSPGEPSSSVALLDLRTGRHRTLAYNLPDEWILSLAFTRDGTRIVGAAHEGTHVWDVASGRLLETYAAKHPRGAGAVLDRRGLVLDQNYDGSLRVWDPDGARRIGRRFGWGSPEQGCGYNPCTVVDPRGALMATSLGVGTVALIDLRTKRLIDVLPARNGYSAEPMAFTPDGRRLVTGGVAGTVTIWDVRSREEADRLRFSRPVTAVAISPDGRLLAVQQEGKTRGDSRVEVLNLRSGGRVRSHRLRFGVGPYGVGELAFTGDGRVLVSSDCCRRSRAVAWDARSGAQLFDVPAATFAVSPDSRMVAAGTDDGHVLFLDAHSGKRLGPAFKVAGGQIAQLAISPDGRLLAVSAFDGTATVWDVESRARLGDAFPVGEGQGLIPQVVFEPSGRLLITELGRAVEWPLDRPTLQRFACQVAGRDLTRDQWRDVLPNRPYRRVCP
jgi:WD40 repeat protein